MSSAVCLAPVWTQCFITIKIKKKNQKEISSSSFLQFWLQHTRFVGTCETVFAKAPKTQPVHYIYSRCQRLHTAH